MSREHRIASSLMACVLGLTLAGPAAADGESLVYTVTLDDVVHGVTARYVINALDKANEADAALFILKLNTPGGSMEAMEDMIHAITSSKAPVVVFVNGSKAASAGFFLTIAADVAVMAPGTRIGAAHPVMLPKVQEEDSPMDHKIENDAAAYVRSLATNRGRDAEAAEEAVRESRSFTEREALSLGLIDYICNSEGEILEVLDGKEIQRFNGETETLDLARVRIESLDMTGRERFLTVLANPALAASLLLLGLLGLYIEFTHPGLIAPGVVGGIFIILFVLSTEALPVNWIGVALIILGLILFILEIKVASYGLLSLGGIGSLVLGSVLLFRDAEGIPGLGAARGVILGVAITAAILMAILTSLVVRAFRTRSVSGASGLVNEVGTALTDLEPEGRIFVHGEYWNARSERPVRKGARVRVTGVVALRLDVEEMS
ncbi:MAG: ATP-dependent Clp protease proteolytic subunit [Acidobacteria bacterium]|nr:ATP-dependent Clp protease proteolytic subunit [Acidobacteriota bacterium]